MKRTAPTSTLNRSSTVSPWPKRELRAAAARVEHDERPCGETETRRRGEVGEPSFLLAGDDLDGDPAAGLHGVCELGGVGCDPEAGGADRRDRDRAVFPRLFRHRRDRLDRALHRLGVQPACLLETLAQPCDLGAVDDRPPGVVGVPFADVELHRVGADVDDRVSPCPEEDELLEAAREADVRPRVQAELAHGGDHTCRVLRFDRDRARRSAVRVHLGQLRHAAADREALPSLVHLDCEQVVAGTHDLVQ